LSRVGLVDSTPAIQRLPARVEATAGDVHPVVPRRPHTVRSRAASKALGDEVGNSLAPPRPSGFGIMAPVMGPGPGTRAVIRGLRSGNLNRPGQSHSQPPADPGPKHVTAPSDTPPRGGHEANRSADSWVRSDWEPRGTPSCCHATLEAPPARRQRGILRLWGTHGATKPSSEIDIVAMWVLYGTHRRNLLGDCDSARSGGSATSAGGGTPCPN